MALLVKQDESYVYLGLKFLADMHTGVDLYIALPSGRQKKLHVSAAIGEAERHDGEWSEIRWGENRLWTANAIGLIVVEGKQQVVRLEGFEFQIERRFFEGEWARLRVHLKRPERILPPDADTENVETWTGLELGNDLKNGVL